MAITSLFIAQPARTLLPRAEFPVNSIIAQIFEEFLLAFVHVVQPTILSSSNLIQNFVLLFFRFCAKLLKNLTGEIVKNLTNKK